MSKHALFAAAEWQALQFAVFDVYMMISGIDGNSATDPEELAAFVEHLENPGRVGNPMLGELLASIPPVWGHVLDAYKTRYTFDGAYFEQSITRARQLVDERLPASEAQDFKAALVVQFGGAIANAAGAVTDLGRVSEKELLAITGIAKWLGVDTTSTARS